jgi:cell fate regulator YaaT (PSP1 superfamily)
MSEALGIRFSQAGKIYYFSTDDTSIEEGDFVVVETNRGKDLGKVVIPPKQVKSENITDPLKPILRKAEEKDFSNCDRFQKKNEHALNKCRELVTKLNLSMKPIAAHYNIDGSHVVIFFIAEKRVDFRELVKELSHELKAYVELRQVGARDEAKLVGGIGKCGQPLCCLSFLTEFSPVSIKMAKEQNITLNPMKTSGLCGRLLCCLGYEFEQYKSLKSTLPSLNQMVETSMGPGKVITINPLKQVVWVQMESGAFIEQSMNDITWKNEEKSTDTREPAKNNNQNG